jgi:hypothetical protein
MRVNAAKFTGASTPSALCTALCQFSCAECQVALPCATALLLINTHNFFWASVGGGVGGVGLIGAVLGEVIFCGWTAGCPIGFCALVCCTVGGDFHSASGSTNRFCRGDMVSPFANLFMLIWARVNCPVIISLQVGAVAGVGFLLFALASATYLSIISSSLSTDSDVETVSI